MFKNALNLKKLDSLITITKANNELGLMVKYAEEYIDLAIETENYKEAIDRGVKIIFYVNKHFGQTSKALEIINKVEKFKDKITDSQLLGNLYLQKGGIYFNGKNHKKAVEYYTRSLDYFSSKDSIYIADSYYFRGQAYFSLNNFNEALTSYNKALNYYTNLKDQAYVFYTKAEIINIHGINNSIKKTIKERQELIREKKQTNFTQGLSIDYLNLSKDFKKAKDYEKQKKYLLKALDIAKIKKNEFYNLSFIYCDLSMYYLNHENIGKAKIYYQLASMTIISNENDNYYYFQKLKGFYLFKTNKLNEALIVAKKSLLNAQKQHYTQNIIDANQLIYKILKQKNNFKKAFKYYEKYHHIKDSLFNLEKLNILYYYQTQHETELKEEKIKNQKTAINNLIKDKKKRRLIFIALIILSIFIMVLIYFLLNSNYLKREQKLQKSYAQNLISYIDSERKRFSKDIHDSLGYKLLLIKNQAVLNKDTKSSELVNDAIDEIRIISKNLQPIQIAQIGITKSIQDLINELNDSYKQILIFGDIESIDDLLASNQEINIYRIIQECLNNIIKHSKAKSAKISINASPKMIILIVKDNGIGFNYKETYLNNKNLGLKTLKNRVDSLNGFMKINSMKNKGTSVKISIPIK